MISNDLIFRHFCPTTVLATLASVLLIFAASPKTLKSVNNTYFLVGTETPTALKTTMSAAAFGAMAKIYKPKLLANLWSGPR